MFNWLTTLFSRTPPASLAECAQTCHRAATLIQNYQPQIADEVFARQAEIHAQSLQRLAGVIEETLMQPDKNAWQWGRLAQNHTQEGRALLEDMGDFILSTGAQEAPSLAEDLKRAATSITAHLKQR